MEISFLSFILMVIIYLGVKAGKEQGKSDGHKEGYKQGKHDLRNKQVKGWMTLFKWKSKTDRKINEALDQVKEEQIQSLEQQVEFWKNEAIELQSDIEKLRPFVTTFNESFGTNLVISNVGKEEFIMVDKIVKLNPFKFTIGYNEHHTMFDTVEEHYDKNAFVSEEEYNNCKETDTVFCGRVYPDNTVGFYEICDGEYNKVVERLYNIMLEEEKMNNI